ncbi:MAG TPA: TetR family transcriptional regulator [Nocardioidaceae bacterium]|nr:TetR family transcriptional regulator [Nocardioidaceae bacterium]
MTDKSARTRARILAAARTEFAEHGFRGATVRAIAREARIDPSMVIRYFGSKSELFEAASEIDLRIPDLTSVPRSRLGEVLVQHFMTRWESEDDSLLLLLRSSTVDERAAERLRSMFQRQLAPALSAVIDEVDEVQARVGLVATQMLGLALTRHLLRLPPVASMSTEQVVARLAPTVQRYLRGPLR